MEDLITGFDRGDRLLSYYRTLQECPRARMPWKSDFNPGQVKDLLNYIVVSERTGPDTLILRIRGGAIEDKLGRHPRGTATDEIFPILPCYEAMLDAMLHTPCAIMIIRSLPWRGQDNAELLTFSLPFAGEQGQPRFVIGVNELILPAGYRSAPPHHPLKHSVIKQMRAIDIGYGAPSLG